MDSQCVQTLLVLMHSLSITLSWGHLAVERDLSPRLTEQVDSCDPKLLGDSCAGHEGGIEVSYASTELVM